MLSDLSAGAKTLAWLAVLGLALLMTGWIMDQVRGQVAVVTKRG